MIAWSTSTGHTNASQVYAYGAYGEPSSWSGSRFRYTGQTMIPEASLYYYKARVYDPVTGRFLQTDPAGFKSDMDLYAYVGEDPLDVSDPTGLAGCDSSIAAHICDQLMADQTQTLSGVRAMRSAIGDLENERAEIKAGTRASLSDDAKATQSALRSAFGSSTDSVAKAVDGNLAKVETFLSDPGTKAGGKYDYRNATLSELKGETNALAYRNPNFRPNTIAVDFLNYLPDDKIDRMQTLIHESLHVFGMERVNINGTQMELYRQDATRFAHWRGGTTSAVYNLPDTYACLVYSSGCY